MNNWEDAPFAHDWTRKTQIIILCFGGKNL